jgi:nucleoid-associated protein YgaU
MKNRPVFIYAIFLAVLALVSCELDVPVREIIDAKQTIDRAREVKAEKYDNKNLESAVEELYKSHKFIKEEKADDAKKSAIKSKNLAMAAIKTSLPLLSKDTIDEAKKIYSEAEEMNAEETADEEFKSAGDEIKKAETLNTGKKYWEAYLEAKDAIGTATAAREKALAVIPELEKKLETLKGDRDVLAANKLSSIAEAELKQAGESLENAAAILQAKKLKEINVAMAKAEEDIRKAREKINAAEELETKKATAAERIKALDEELKTLKANRGEELAPEEVKAAGTLLGESNELLSAGKLDEATEKITEAEGEVANAKKKMEVALAKEKIISVTNLYDKTKARDTENKYEAELNEANALLVSSRQMFEEKNYNETLMKAEEAELILKTITIEIEKTVASTETGKDISGEGQEKVVYTVRWRKRNTDCLWRISLRVYKNARLWPYIYRANKSQIKDPDLIFPGQKFIIPSIKDIRKKKKGGGDIKEKPEPDDKGKGEARGTEEKGKGETVTDTEEKKKPETSEEE